MWEAWGVVVAALALAFGVAKHHPVVFDAYAQGVLFVAYPALATVFGWDAALTVTRISLNAALKPDALALVTPVLSGLRVPESYLAAGAIGLIGLSAIRALVRTKP